MTGLTAAHHVQVLFDAGGFGGSGYFTASGTGAKATTSTASAPSTARSKDGLAWTDDQPLTQEGTTVIFDSGANWNRGSYGPIALIYNASGSANLDDTNVFNNRYVMYYDGTTGGQEAWGLAYSTDGILWKGYNGGVTPVLPVGAPGAWDDAFATHGSVIHNQDGSWELWYSGGRTASSQGMGHATSSNGIVWTRIPQIR